MEQTHFESLYPPQTREREVQRVIEFIKEGNSCQILALPGVGRSNLLSLLSYNRNLRIRHLGEEQTRFHFVLVDFAQIRKKPLFEATKFLFLELVDSLRERKMIEEYASVNELFKESLEINDELVLFQGLKRAIDYLALEKELTIVFLFNRFETYISMLTSDFFSNLRTLRNRAKYHFSVVFSLNRPLEEMVEPVMLADFYEFLAGHTIYLPIQDSPGMEFRVAYLEKTKAKKIDQKLLKGVMKLTAGHGKMTRLCLEALLGFTQDVIPTNSKENLGNFLLAQKTVIGALMEIWLSLTPQEQKCLASGSGPQTSSLEDQNFEYLAKVGLLKDGKITIPLFQEFLQTEMQTLAAGVGANKLQFNSASNDIIKGETVISDRFTAGEFKLLRHFLQNPERVVERDELVQVVWEEAKSTAGVTDQAIDQLVFRLRKKIEVDPNNPGHLQTVKGRGFRFSAEH